MVKSLYRSLTIVSLIRMTTFHENMTKEKFFVEWFGLTEGKEIGTNKPPRRNWTDNPQEFIDFVKMCNDECENKEFCRPCWISSQPMRYIKSEQKYGYVRKIGEACAIEKLFFDFDDDTKYCSKCDEFIKKDELVKDKQRKGSFCPKCGTQCFEKPRKEIVANDVTRFITGAKEMCKIYNFEPIPFIVGTRKGYHVYFFLCEIFKFESTNFGFAKMLYKQMQDMLKKDEFEFMDRRIIGDLNRLARVPLTRHEKTGKMCQVLDENLNPTKVRSLEYYKLYGIQLDFIKDAVKVVKKLEYEKMLKKKEQLEKFEDEGIKDDSYPFKGMIRPCFTVRMTKGEMNHAQRLAWLSEIYYAGYNTEEKMLELCRKTFNDFTEKESLNQIRDYFKHERWNFRPYKCSTIQSKGWCIGTEACANEREIRIQNTNKAESI